MITHERRADDRADGMDSRNRDIATIDRIFRPTGGPARYIDEVLAARGSADVVEIGFGWGVALLDLVWRYRSHPVRFHGIDIEPKASLITDDGVVDWAVTSGCFPAGTTAADVTMPTFAFYDATDLRLPDESVDVVYSAVTIRFLADKVRCIEEVARVLRPGGVAILHLGESNWEYPHGPSLEAPRLTETTSRLVLRCGNTLVPLAEYLEASTGPCTVDVPRGDRLVVLIRKHAHGRLDLGLELDRELTLSGRAVPLLNRRGEVRGGMRSVYAVPAARYDALLEQGTLGPVG